MNQVMLRRVACLIMLFIVIGIIVSVRNYSEVTPTKNGILLYLASHGILGAKVNVYVTSSGDVRQVMIYKYGRFENSDRICAPIHELTDLIGDCERFDLQYVTNCTRLVTLHVGGVIEHEELLFKFPNLVDIKGFVKTPLEDENVVERIKRCGGTLSIRLSSDNVQQLLNCEVPEIYWVYVTNEMLTNLSPDVIKELETKSFRAINNYSCKYFWRRCSNNTQ